MESLQRTSPSTRPLTERPGATPSVPIGGPFAGVLADVERESTEEASPLVAPTWTWMGPAPEVSGVLRREASTRALERSSLGSQQVTERREDPSGAQGRQRNEQGIETRTGFRGARGEAPEGTSTEGRPAARNTTLAGQAAPSGGDRPPVTAPGSAPAPIAGAPLPPAAAQALAALAQAAPAAKAPAVQPVPLTQAAPAGVTSVASTGAVTKAQAPQAASSAARAESILGQVRMALTPRTRTAVLRLDPAELGRLRVELHVDQGKARAHMIVERPEALAALESHLPELRALFEQQGLEVEGFELSLAEPGDETPFQDRPDEQRTDGASSKTHPSDASEDDLDPARVARHLAGGSALDLIA